MLKEEVIKHPSASSSSSDLPSLVTTSTTSKMKSTSKSTTTYQPPDILICNVMQPICLSNKENTAVSLNTNVVKSFRIDFTKYLEDSLMLEGGDDDSTECVADIHFKRNIIIPFCKELAREILGDDQTKKVNAVVCIVILFIQ